MAWERSDSLCCQLKQFITHLVTNSTVIIYLLHSSYFLTNVFGVNKHICTLKKKKILHLVLIFTIHSPFKLKNTRRKFATDIASLLETVHFSLEKCICVPTQHRYLHSKIIKNTAPSKWVNSPFAIALWFLLWCASWAPFSSFTHGIYLKNAHLWYFIFTFDFLSLFVISLPRNDTNSGCVQSASLIFILFFSLNSVYASTL